MIDKVKTINKAKKKYHAIIPAHGKHSLEESFFILRGEIFFQFKTKDKKIHTVKAEKFRPTRPSQHIDRAVLGMVFRMVNRPIFIRSLFIKNRKSTPLMLGFYTM